MTSDEIIKLIQDNGLTLHGDIEHFAALVRNDYSNKHAQLWLTRIDEAVKAEREACAEAAGPEDSYRDEWFNAKADSVKRILARSNT